MPPKPKPLRKPSNTASPVKLPDKGTSKMQPPALPKAILEPEMDLISQSLKAAVVKTGQIYGFYADSRKLGLQHDPPRSLVASLGREIEKYDQMCDSMEAQLLRAISVLRRDLSREEQKIKAVALASISTRTRSKSSSPTLTRIDLPSISDTAEATAPEATKLSDVLMSPPNETANNTALSPTVSVSARRPSAVSLSTLHRPPFPLKLDLSSTALRMTAEEFSNGLASPVTLAPKSARPMDPNELADDILAAFASSGNSDTMNIDLTVPVDDILPQPMNGDGNGNVGGPIGSSSDKPIELDLDLGGIEMDVNMSDLFGDDGSDDVQGLFTPVNERSESGKEQDNPDNAADPGNSRIFDALVGLKPDEISDDAIFASFTAQSNQQTSNSQQDMTLSDAIHTSELADQSSSLNMGNSTPFNQSAGALLDGFAGTAVSATNQPFDLESIDLSTLSPGFFQAYGGDNQLPVDGTTSTGLEET